MTKEAKLFVAGILISALVYTIPLYFGKAWLGLFLLLLTGIAYLGVLTKYFNIHVESIFARRGFFLYALLLVTFHALAFAYDYGRKDFQKEILLQIRQTIEEGITKSTVQKQLVYVLGQYHLQEENSLVETVEQILSENLGEYGEFIELPDQEPKPDDAMDYFYIKDREGDSFSVIGVSNVLYGASPEFQNYDGQVGRLELRVILSKEGVRYEVVN
ncbi:MAG: hypothetical protein MI700_10055 [Balneolales bacterium]|nr:hypothetical protein [Balneolales bacterium]